MKLKYFGTAAAEGIPAIGCKCKTCEYARKVGGKNIRGRTQALINEDLLIDFPPDTLWHTVRFNPDYDKIKACLISHAHSDHLAVEQINLLQKGYCVTERKAPIEFYSCNKGYEEISPLMQNERMQGRASVSLIQPLKRFNVGGYSILPLPASHDQNSSPVLYLIENKGKSILWAHDTGMLSEETLNALKKEKPLDLISIDCCAGLLKGWRGGHLGLDTCLETFENLEKLGILNKQSIKVINHFSHNDLANYDDLLPYEKEYGIIVSYDGLEIEI